MEDFPFYSFLWVGGGNWGLGVHAYPGIARLTQWKSSLSGRLSQDPPPSKKDKHGYPTPKSAPPTQRKEQEGKSAMERNKFKSNKEQIILMVS